MFATPLLEHPVSPAEAICRVLEQAGIRHVIGIPGGTLMPLFDALFDHRDTITTHLVRQETLGAIMAEVHGRVTGQPIVVIAQGAWVLANCAMGMLEALTGGSPMLVLTDLSDRLPFSHHSPYQAGTGDYGNWDARRALGGFTKRVIESHHPAQAVQQVQLALKHAMTGCPGPVAVIHYSSALQGTVGPGSVPRLYATQAYRDPTPRAAELAALETAAALLRDAERPVIVAGGGVRTAQASDALLAAAEALGAPVVTTGSGKGTIPETHPLAGGVVGDYGHGAAMHLLGEADVVLAVGTRLGPGDTLRQNPVLLDPTRQTLIQIDVDPLHVGWTYPIACHLVGDAGRVLADLTAALGQCDKGGAQRVRDAEGHGWFDAPESLSDVSPILPQRLIKILSEALPEDAVVCADAGENRIFLLHHYRTRRAGGYLQPSSIGGMGYGIPGALGMQLADPSRTAVAVVGDGGFAMTMNGLMSARELNLPIIVVVMTNGSLAWVKHVQGNRVIASELGEFDHAAIARAMGCEGYRVTTIDELRAAIADAVAADRPAVIDVIISDGESWEKVTSPLSELSQKLAKPQP